MHNFRHYIFCPSRRGLLWKNSGCPYMLCQLNAGITSWHLTDYRIVRVMGFAVLYWIERAWFTLVRFSTALLSKSYRPTPDILYLWADSFVCSIAHTSAFYGWASVKWYCWAQAVGTRHGKTLATAHFQVPFPLSAWSEKRLDWGGLMLGKAGAGSLMR